MNFITIAISIYIEVSVYEERFEWYTSETRFSALRAAVDVSCCFFVFFFSYLVDIIYTFRVILAS